MDIHEIADATPEKIAEAHQADLEVQHKYGVNYLKYWLNEDKRRVFCLCTAPDAKTADRVHRESHGMPAERIIEVDPDLADGLLGGGAVASTGAVVVPDSTRIDPGIRTLLFTDIVDSTAMTQRLGDQAAMKVVDLHDRIVRDAVSSHRGREVKHLGDGIMAAFVSALAGVQCAASVQAGFRAALSEAGSRVQVRIGLAAGEPVEREGDFFGSTVQLAARLCAKAQPGQILVSTSVTELCTSLHFADAGEFELKGFAQPTRAHTLAD